MELEDLVLLKHYRVERHGDVMVAVEDEDGNYKAPSAKDLEDALNIRKRIRKEDRLFVRHSRGRGAVGTWFPMIRIKMK